MGAHSWKRVAVWGRVTRAVPRRKASRYSTGSMLRLRDGRVFIVVEVERTVWEDPSYGNGGGREVVVAVKEWELLPEGECVPCGGTGGPSSFSAAAFLGECAACNGSGRVVTAMGAVR